MATSTLTSKGQITLPRVVRERLGVKQGDRVEFSVDGDRVSLRPAHTNMQSPVVGLLRHLRPSKPVSIDQMRAAVRRRVSGRGGPRP